jgi:[ribosomal protein S5]-alanine N-acetyltransferase
MDYFLSTHRLGFRRWREEDLPLAAALWGDSDVMALMGGPMTPDAVKARLAQEIAHMRDLRIQYWPFFLLEGDQFAGCAGLRPREHQAPVDGPKAPAYQMGYHLLPRFWGQGIATEAARAVIDYSFGALGVEALFAAHHPLNRRSGNVLLKLGFVAVGEELYPPTGLMHPTYRCLRPG